MRSYDLYFKNAVAIVESSMIFWVPSSLTVIFCFKILKAFHILGKFDKNNNLANGMHYI